MIPRTLAFLFVSFVLFVAADAQTPAPGAQGEAKTFSMFFDGDGAYLGVQTEEVTKENLAKYGLREVRGVAIEKVIEGSPAEKAGLQNGDVIVRLNNDEITSVRKLTRLLGEISPDHQVTITVVRGGTERELVATVVKRPVPKFHEGAFAMTMPRIPFPHAEMMPMPRVEGLPGIGGESYVFGFGSGRRIGVSVTTLTKQLSDHFGVASGVMISEVRADSPAAKAGLKAGDIIVEVDGKVVKGEVDLIRALGEKKDGDVALTFVRDGIRQTVRITPEVVKNQSSAYYISPMPPLPDRPSTPSGGAFPTLFPQGIFPRLHFPRMH